MSSPGAGPRHYSEQPDLNADEGQREGHHAVSGEEGAPNGRDSDRKAQPASQARGADDHLAQDRLRAPAPDGVGAPSLHLGNLQYQVQISRRLNPADSEDTGYLIGLPPGQKLLPGQTW